MLIFRSPVAPSERAGATDANCSQIESIDVHSCLGYEGRGREEHSGENAPLEPDDLLAYLADNRSWQIEH